MIYLASPYSHPDYAVRHARYEEARRHVVSHSLSHTGPTDEFLFSPIVYGHQIAAEHNLRFDAKYWERFNVSLLRACTALHVLCLPGWEESNGVAAEITLADILFMEVQYIGNNN
jgi:hypothetical protein